ncbi:MAG: hypothetical protein ABW168_21510 [Sedimenticola sp.]
MSKSFTINGVEIIYTEHKFGGDSSPYDHFELRSEFMGPTGYQSHFEPSVSVNSYGSPEKCALDLITFYWTVPEAASSNMK